MSFKTNSWKEKIDPAFDKIIHYLLKLFDYAGLPSKKGWIVLEDDCLEQWERQGMKGWIKKYESSMADESKTLLHFPFPKRVTDKEKTKAVRDFREWLFNEIKPFPQESQAYYIKALELFHSEELNRIHFNGISTDKWKETIEKFFIDSMMLAFHRLMIDAENELQTVPKEKLLKKYNAPSTILDILLGIYDCSCRMVFEKSLVDLIKKARIGNEESFFNLLQIDRTALECDWAHKMIRKAQLSGNEEFFKEMAKAIRTSPLKNKKYRHGKTTIILLVLWRLGLNRLENNELIELLEGCGIEIPDDPESFRRYINRLFGDDKDKSPFTFHQNDPSIK